MFWPKWLNSLNSFFDCWSICNCLMTKKGVGSQNNNSNWISGSLCEMSCCDYCIPNRTNLCMQYNFLRNAWHNSQVVPALFVCHINAVLTCKLCKRHKWISWEKKKRKCMDEDDRQKKQRIKRERERERRDIVTALMTQLGERDTQPIISIALNILPFC